MFIDNQVENVAKVLPFKDPSVSDAITIPSILLEKEAGEKIYNT